MIMGINEIIAAIQCRDFVLIFTKNGDIYKAYYDELDGKLMFYKLYNLFSN